MRQRKIWTFALGTVSNARVIVTIAILPEIEMEQNRKSCHEEVRPVGLDPSVEKIVREVKNDAETIKKRLNAVEKELDKLEKPILLKLRNPMQ